MPATTAPGPPDPDAHAARVRTAYDTVADAYAALLPGTEAETPLDLATVGAFAALVGTTGPVADVGCGAGRMTAHLAALGLAAHGLDLSPAMVAAARRAHPTLPFVVGSLAALPYADVSQTGVLAWYSLIHVPPAQLPGVAAELHRVLAPGGHLLVGVQAGDGPRHLSRAYGHDVDLDAWLWRPDELAGVLTRAGLDVRARVVREPEAHERHPQAFLLARRPG